MSGKIVNIFIKPGSGEAMRPTDEVAMESNMGMVGDASFGRSKRQVLVIEKETLDEFGLVPGQVRENITVSGIQLAGLPAGTTLRSGDVLMEVTLDCAPCQFIEDIRPGLRADIQGRRGTLFRVLSGGTVRVHDQVMLVQPPAESA